MQRQTPSRSTRWRRRRIENIHAAQCQPFISTARMSTVIRESHQKRFPLQRQSAHRTYKRECSSSSQARRAAVNLLSGVNGSTSYERRSCRMGCRTTASLLKEMQGLRSVTCAAGRLRDLRRPPFKMFGHRSIIAKLLLHVSTKSAHRKAPAVCQHQSPVPERSGTRQASPVIKYKHAHWMHRLATAGHRAVNIGHCRRTEGVGRRKAPAPPAGRRKFIVRHHVRSALPCQALISGAVLG